MIDLERELVIARLYSVEAGRFLFDLRAVNGCLLPHMRVTEGSPVSSLGGDSEVYVPIFIRSQGVFFETNRAAMRAMKADGYVVPALRREIAKELKMWRVKLKAYKDYIVELTDF